LAQILLVASDFAQLRQLHDSVNNIENH